MNTELRARSWHAHKASLQAQLAEAEATVESLPAEAEQAREELEQAKLALQEAQTSHDAARGRFELLGEQVREAKRKVLELTSELRSHDEQQPRGGDR